MGSSENADAPARGSAVRNVRSRDALGRPLPHGAAGVPALPTGVSRTPAATLHEAQRLLDAGWPFQAHEVLEDAWKAAPPAERDLWRGLAQLAVGVTHAARGNPRGAEALVRRGAALVAPAELGDRYDVDVAGLLAWADRAVADIRAGTEVTAPRLRRDTGHHHRDRGDSPMGTTTSGSPGAETGTPAALIDARIQELGDWRGEMLARVRAVIKRAEPDVVEEWKWRGVPVWSSGGIICTGETYKNVVKLTFAKGASLEDPSGLFNASLEGNTRRAIDIHAGDTVDETALTALIRAAVARNSSSAGSTRARRTS